MIALPVKVESACENVGLSCAEDCLLAGDRVNPIEHHANSVTPVPIAAECKIVVLAGFEIVEVQV